ncbi:MAG TPA: hypothetical protein VFR57_10770 [Burkholderiales bacterium]|jgi:hypothetical protein|nr:hypothetical protein [Burkholderiales bacterium]HSA70062.1 hypothetical protein [Burkholderiales bacterium]
MRRNSERALLVAALAFAGCAEMPPEYIAVKPGDAAQRELQGRRFDGIGEKELLDAAVGVLQDLGFTVDITSAELGFVQGAKEREAKAPDQTLVILIVAALAASQGSTLPAGQMRQDQTISVLLTVRQAREGDMGSHIVLVTFHNHVRQPLMRTAGPLRDPVLYQSFFELLSKALFLQAHKL